MSWNLDGFRLLAAAGTQLVLYQHALVVASQPAITGQCFGRILLISCSFTAAQPLTTPAILLDPAKPPTVTFGYPHDDEEELEGGRGGGGTNSSEDNQVDDVPAAPTADWTCVWQVRLPNAVEHLKYSPDGALFATTAKHDRLVKVWYEEMSG